MISLVAFFLLAATPAHAPPCWLVKTYVELLGEKAARAKGKGKAHGYTDVEIDATRARCFGK
jgi:hypothetical protein